MRQTFPLALATAIAVTALVAASARPAAAAAPGRNGLIAFVSERHGQGPGIYTMHTDGTGLVQLTSAQPDASAPAFSPDGRTIAFQVDRDDGLTSEVWLAAANGTRLRPLLHNAGGLPTESPAWSPDGRWIAYVEAPEHGVRPRIYLAHPDGTGRHKLVDGSDPAWSPDGKLIAFDRGSGIWTIRPDGGGRRHLHGGFAPDWSPDGRRIAFLRPTCGSCSTQAYVMDANGTHEHQLTKNLSPGIAQDAGPPAWSPDGKLIAVASCCIDAPGEPSLVAPLDVVRPDGSGRRTLARGSYGGLAYDEPTWSPDGRRIVVSDFGLFVLNADGTGRRAFFPRTSESAGNPTWSPDGRRIAFDAGLNAWVMDSNGGSRRKLGEFTPLSWSPDGRKIVGQEIDADVISVLDLATGRRNWILVDDGAGDSTKGDPAWSPKGPIAYLDDYEAPSGVLSLYTFGRHPPTQRVGLETEGGLAWSPDGRLLAYSWQGSIWVYDMKTRARRLLIRNAFDAVFSPDGRRIAYVRAVTRTNTEIFVARSDGTGEKKITANPGADAQPSWQPVR